MVQVHLVQPKKESISLANRIEEVTLEYLTWFVKKISGISFMSDKLRTNLLYESKTVFHKAPIKDLKLALEVAVDVRYSRTLR